MSVTSDNVPAFNVIADNGDPNKQNELVVDTYLVGVERIDLREYADVNTLPGADDAELYVVDSYQYLEGGQGDLGDMYYVTSLGHSNFDIHLGEDPLTEPQVLSEVLLEYDANIYYSGHHTDSIDSLMQVYGQALVQQQQPAPHQMQCGMITKPYSLPGMILMILEEQRRLKLLLSMTRITLNGG